MNVESKIYYLKENGTVIYTTGEFVGGNIKTTFEQDYEIVDTLKQYPISAIGCIELEFGTYLNAFINSKSYVVDLATKQLKVEYLTQAEIDEINNNIPLSEAEQLEIDNANLLLELVQKDILINQLQGGV